MIQCQKCKFMFEDSHIHEHHILPNGVRKNNLSIEHGEKVSLCKKCHDEIHSLLPDIVKEFTKSWITKKF
jgi:hypothetical protein